MRANAGTASSQCYHLYFNECSMMELRGDCDGSRRTMRAEHFGVNAVDVGPQVNVADVNGCTHYPAQIGARGFEDRGDVGNGLPGLRLDAVRHAATGLDRQLSGDEQETVCRD